MLLLGRARTQDGVHRPHEGGHVLVRGGASQGEPLRGARVRLGAAGQGRDHVRGLGDAGRAGRAGRGVQAGRVEGEQQRVRGPSRHGDVHVAGQPAGAGRQGGAGGRVDVAGPGQRGRLQGVDGGDHLVPQRAEPGGLGGLLRDGLGDGGRERGREGDRHGAGAQPALLAAAVQDRLERGVAPHEQRPHAHRGAELVARQGEGGRPGGREVHGDGADGLDGVGVQRHAVGGGDPGRLRHRLDRADLVVRPHQRGQRGPLRRRRQRGLPRREVHRALRVDGHEHRLGALVGGEPVHDVEHGVVLGAGEHDAGPLARARTAGPVQPLDGQVVRLGAAGGQHHLGRVRPQGGRDRLTGLLETQLRPAPRGVQGRRVARDRGGLGEGRERARTHRRGGGVVQVHAGGGSHPPSLGSPSRPAGWPPGTGGVRHNGLMPLHDPAPRRRVRRPATGGPA